MKAIKVLRIVYDIIGLVALLYCLFVILPKVVWGAAPTATTSGSITFASTAKPTATMRIKGPFAKSPLEIIFPSDSFVEVEVGGVNLRIHYDGRVEQMFWTRLERQSTKDSSDYWYHKLTPTEAK